MRRTWFTLAASVAAFALLVSLAGAQTVNGFETPKDDNNFNGWPDFAVGVQNRDANPSPNSAVSGINNYVQQDEQINLDANSGVVRVLRTDEKNLIQDYVTKAIPVHNLDPIEILGPIRNVVAKEGGRAEPIRDKVKKANFIQVVAPAWQIPYVEQAVQALDEDWVSSWNDGTADLYYQAKFREVARVDRIAADFGGSYGYGSIDTHNNAIFYHDEPYRVSYYLEGAKQVDVPEHMIHVEGAIYELNRTNDLKLGLDYIAWKNGPGRNLFDFLVAGHDAYENYVGASSIYNPGLVSFLNSRYPQGADTAQYDSEGAQEYFSVNFLLTAAYLDFLQSKGKAKVIGRPSVTTRSGTVGTWEDLQPIAAFEAADIIDINQDIAEGNLTTDPGSRGSTPVRLRDVVTVGNYVGTLNFQTPLLNDIIFVLDALGVNVNFLLGGNAVPNNPAALAAFLNVELDGMWDYINKHYNGSFAEFRDAVAALVDGYAAGVVNVSNRTVRYKNAAEIGHYLRVLPFIGTETTELAVEFEATDLNGYTPQGQPILATRSYETTVRIADGQPFVVGGVKRTENVKQSQGIPGLKSIPVLGWLFGGETKIDRESDVAMVLTPSVYIGAASDMEMPANAQTIVGAAMNEAQAEIPANPLGFDQWLLDPEK